MDRLRRLFNIEAGDSIADPASQMEQIKQYFLDNSLRAGSNKEDIARLLNKRLVSPDSIRAKGFTFNQQESNIWQKVFTDENGCIFLNLNNTIVYLVKVAESYLLISFQNIEKINSSDIMTLQTLDKNFFARYAYIPTEDRSHWLIKTRKEIQDFLRRGSSSR